MDPDGMKDEDYDAINAPQFLDFSLLGINSDDDEADRFFETHREEDDHFVPAENLSPTIHLLNENGDRSEIEELEEPSSSSPVTKVEVTCVDEINFQSPEKKIEEPEVCSTEPKHFNEMTDNVNENAAMEESQNAEAPLISLVIEDIEHTDSSIDDNKENKYVTPAADIHTLPDSDHQRENDNMDTSQENRSDHSPNAITLEHVKLNDSMSKKQTKQIPQHLIKCSAAPFPSKYTTKVTVPQPFNLHQTRPRIHVPTKDEETEFKFKAKPVPVKALHGSTIKRKIETKVTEPKAPHFASEDRIRERQEKKAATLTLPTSPKEGCKKSGPSSIASSSRSYKPPTPKKIMPPTPTKVQPFSFAARDEEMLRKKGQKMQQELERKIESFTFHAKPLPSFKPKLPKKIMQEVTNFEPFKLLSEERGALYQQTWKSKLEKEEREMKEHKIFHANPPTVLYKKPFEPLLGILPLAEPLDIQLNTDKRAQERELYEEQMRKREREEKEQRQMEEAIRKEQERQEEIQLRKQLVHKPNPLKPLRAFQIKSSDKPLTNPQSPAFAPLPSQRRGLEKGKFPSNGGLNTAL